MAKTQVNTELVILNCSVCFGPIALGEGQHKSFREQHKTFYCPSGHSQYYPTKSDADKLRDELDVAQDRVRQVEYERNNASNMLEAETKKRKKLESRIRNGVCPECHRSFVNLQRHMEGRHPSI